ncbi:MULTISPECIES: hypothetical protein [unclassified Mesorhizobium]|uniref:hypothetical protein n=1 Tax=unclassified Mesorhizobium TaxID=325217 RepID=UPI00112B2E44|nr:MULTISPECIES: hypothetical protein [unclassified Mesorhizobium]TPJ51754.1 hypothetical protein FJ426_18785 [Mesorhizobium sp. B2-6-4]TPN42376.1 hypothetical protein FJ979_02200 [Mesorhizobium sp. B1-1-6]
MNRKIDFPQLLEPIYAHGRNGFFQAAALNVLEITNSCLVLENWTSKGTIGRGRVVLPVDRNVVRDLANHLNRIADRLP